MKKGMKVTGFLVVLMLFFVGFSRQAHCQTDIDALINEAEQGDALAQNKLGKAYFDGNGVAMNIEKAFTWFEKAANQGLVDAQMAMGYGYESGIGVEPDNKKAITWYEKAADQGEASAQFSLGMLNYISRDYMEALKWFNIAAAFGNENATLHQGRTAEKLPQGHIEKAQELANKWIEEYSSKQ